LDQNKVAKSLKRSLFSSVGMIIIACYFLWFNIYNDHPAILSFALFIGIPVLLFVIIMISLDLIYQDKQTCRGIMSEKRHNKIVVTNAAGDSSMYRLPNEQFDHIEVGIHIELCYYKRTKAVTSIIAVPDTLEEDYSI